MKNNHYHPTYSLLSCSSSLFSHALLITYKSKRKTKHKSLA